MPTEKITLTFGKGNPPQQAYLSTWFLIYQKVRAAKQGKWEYVELPADKLGKALGSVKGYCRRNKISVSLRVDKSKVFQGIGIIWYTRK